MNTKILLLTLAVGSISTMEVYAEEHHGFYWMPAASEVEDFLNSNTDDSVPRWLCPWFTPELIMPMIVDGNVITETSLFPSENGTTDMLNIQDNILGGGEYADRVTGAVMSYNFDNGYIEVTVPSQLTNPLSSPSTYTGTDGVALFHLRLGGGDGNFRINDQKNTLSYNHTRAYLSDCTGVYVGIKAPAGCTVKAYITTTNIAKKTLALHHPDPSSSATAAYDSYTPFCRTAAFDCGSVSSDDYVELTSGAPYNSLACINYSSDSWPDGYCAKNVDIAVYGVKPGDKVGLAGVQTLHPGWTPVPFDYTSGIEAVSADVDANAPIEYFNIQGVKVAADNLTPGLYITRQGSKATKVLVK
jgi:hypothetical protein